jgi:hypothetical protein
MFSKFKKDYIFLKQGNEVQSIPCVEKGGAMSWTQSKTVGRAVMSVPIIGTLGLGTWQVRDYRDLANPCGCSLCALVARGYKARIPTGQAG